MTRDFLSHISDNIARCHLLVPDKPVIVAVSGGADSVALLVALEALGYQCIAAHCNYHLRGEESNRDMRSVQKLCARLGIDLYVKDFDVAVRQKATGESVEMACRELRYQWFADLLDRQRAQAIAVAHHREDNIETFMLNLMRGSGIAGLSGMKWRNGYVIRPMLDFSREEIEHFLADRGFGFVNDSTNAESVYSRNRLRNIVLPAIESNFPGALSGMLASISHLADNHALYEALVAEKKNRYYDSKRIALSQLVHDEQQPRMLLFEILRPLGFNMTQVDNILASAGKSGLVFTADSSMGFGDRLLTSHARLELNRGVLSVSILDGDVAQTSQHASIVSLQRDILTPVHILVSEHPVAQFRPERNANVAYFDSAILLGNPRFELRPWRKGDRITPFGMAKAKLVSDLFTNAKYSAEDKRNTYVLTRDGTIVWVVGLRQSSLFSIIPETRKYLRLELKKH